MNRWDLIRALDKSEWRLISSTCLENRAGRTIHMLLEECARAVCDILNQGIVYDGTRGEWQVENTNAVCSTLFRVPGRLWYGTKLFTVDESSAFWLTHYLNTTPYIIEVRNGLP